MSTRRFMPALTLLCLFACGPGAAETTLESEADKTLYALGLAISQRLTTFELSEDEVKLVQAGLADGALGRDAKVEIDTYGPLIDPFLREKLEVVTEREKEAGATYLAETAEEAGAIKTDSGMVYVEQQTGDGASPESSSTVKVNYTGTFRDGEVFDASEPDEPATLSLAAMAPCFSEGVGRMKVGGKSKLVCPPELAYGDRGFPPLIPPGTTLTFEVELLEILAADAAAAPAAPATP